MRKLKLVPSTTSIPFVKARNVAFVISIIAVLGSIGTYVTQGLNFGVDFEGGVSMTIRTPGPANISLIRDSLTNQGLGEVTIQEFGSETDVSIRLPLPDGDESQQQEIILSVSNLLAASIGEFTSLGDSYVGPKVSAELVEAGTLAVLLAVGAMLIYIWFRFEWQFSVGAIVALVHDVVLTIGLFSITQLEFNLSIVAAILAIVGYSMNDTVVVYDRVRENMRKYKQMPLQELLNLSINDTLSRTVMTSLTTLTALFSLYFLGGEVIRGFTFAMIWGILVGTYSSIFIAAPVLLLFNVRLGATATADAS